MGERWILDSLAPAINVVPGTCLIFLSRIISVSHQLALILFSSTSLPPYSSPPGWFLPVLRYLCVPEDLRVSDNPGL